MLITGFLWLASFCLGCYRVWTEAKSIPTYRLRQIWGEEERLYGEFSGLIRRPEDLDEAWEQQFSKRLEEPFPTLSRFLYHLRFALWLKREIKRAHVNIDIGSAFAILLLSIVASFSLSLIGLSIISPQVSPVWRLLIASMVAIVAPIAFIGWLRHKQHQFIRKVEAVLPDTLSLMANALRAGMGFQQALELVSMEGLPPLKEEFAIVNRSITLGASMEEALQSLLERVPSNELNLVVTAVLVQREVGGSMAKLLDVASLTVRNRIRLRQEIRAETSLTRSSAYALAFGLPALIFLFANFATIFTNSEPWSQPMFTDPMGLKAWGLILLLELAGWFWIKRVLEMLEE